MADRAAAAAAMRSLGRPIVVLTSFEGRDTPAGMLGVLAVEDKSAWRVSLPKIQGKFSGAGDLFAALFLSFGLAARDVRAALGQSCALLQEVLVRTRNLGDDELALVASRHQLMGNRPLVLAEPLA